MEFKKYKNSPASAELDVEAILARSCLKKKDVSIEALGDSAWREKSCEFFIPSLNDAGELGFDVYEADIEVPIAEITAQNPQFLESVIRFMFSKSYQVLVVSRLREIELNGRKELKVVFWIYGQRPGTLKEHTQFEEKIRCLRKRSQQTTLDALERAEFFRRIDNLAKK